MNGHRGSIATRTVKSLAVGRGTVDDAIGYARGKGWHSNEHEVVESIKAMTDSIGTDGYPVPYPAAFDFAEFIRPQTIIGKLTGLRHVPSQTRLIQATGGSTAYWSGERSPRPVSKMAFLGTGLPLLSIVAMLVTTLELLRSSAPTAESILSADLARAAVAAMDAAFVDPANAGILDVKPASISNGVVPIVSAGNTVANIDADMGLLIQALIDAGSDLAFATFIMLPKTALYFARKRGTNDELAYPGMSAKGGTLLGLPVITSTAIPAAAGISSITLIDPSQVLIADDNTGTLGVSLQSTIEVADDPADDNSERSLMSMYQSNAATLRTLRYVNWARVRPGVAQVLTGVNFPALIRR